MLRDVAEPEPVRGVGAELPFHEILVRGRVRLPAAPLAAMRDANQSVQSHEPRDALAAHLNTEARPQLCEHPRGAIDLAGV